MAKKVLKPMIDQCPASYRRASSTMDTFCKFKYADERAHRFEHSHETHFGEAWIGPPYAMCQWTVQRGDYRSPINFHCLYRDGHRGPHKIGTGEYEPNWADRQRGKYIALPKHLQGVLKKITEETRSKNTYKEE